MDRFGVDLINGNMVCIKSLLPPYPYKLNQQGGELRLYDKIVAVIFISYLAYTAYKKFFDGNIGQFFRTEKYIGIAVVLCGRKYIRKLGGIVV